MLQQNMFPEDEIVLRLQGSVTLQRALLLENADQLLRLMLLVAVQARNCIHKPGEVIRPGE